MTSSKDRLINYYIHIRGLPLLLSCVYQFLMFLNNLQQHKAMNKLVHNLKKIWKIKIKNNPLCNTTQTTVFSFPPKTFMLAVKRPPAFSFRYMAEVYFLYLKYEFVKCLLSPLTQVFDSFSPIESSRFVVKMSDTWSDIQAHKKKLDSLRERLQRRRKDPTQLGIGMVLR